MSWRKSKSSWTWRSYFVRTWALDFGRNCFILKNQSCFIASIKVVNDAEEYSIALMSSFNQSITETESEM